MGRGVKMAEENALSDLGRCSDRHYPHGADKAVGMLSPIQPIWGK